MARRDRRRASMAIPSVEGGPPYVALASEVKVIVALTLGNATAFPSVPPFRAATGKLTQLAVRRPADMGSSAMQGTVIIRVWSDFV